MSKYHNNKEYLNLIEKKFGKKAVDNILEMTKINLKRKIIFRNIFNKINMSIIVKNK